MNDDQELRKRVEETVDRVIEKIIVEEVLKLCAALPRDCLAVFHGSNQGFDCALRSLAAMKQRMNVRFRAAVAPAARELLPEMRIKEALSLDLIYSMDSPLLPSIIGQSDLIILPTLTISQASKLALGIRDESSAKLISDAVISRKMILAAVDGAVVKDGPPAYCKMTADHLEILASFGIKLSSAKSLGTTAMGMLGSGQCKDPAGKSVHIHDRIITWSQLAGIEEGTRLVVQKDAVLTPLAKELIHEKQLKLEQTAGRDGI